MRDIWIPKAWLRIGTGLIALAIIAAIWINYRLELRHKPPPPERPAAEGASEPGQERR
jgi:TRAP-type C4-dicarboxylate transport system permease small subunit